MIPLPTITRGGLHPEDRKSATRIRAIWNASLPHRCVVPLHQHAGTAAEPVVAIGERVREGMLIGRANGRSSANIHAPVPGVVVDRVSMRMADGSYSDCYVIELEGEFDRLGKPAEPADWQNRSPRDLLRTLRDCGVVGMGGDCLPVDLKYAIPRGVEIDRLIINGVESEPYVSADHRLMVEAVDAILEGIRIAERIVRPRRITIAIGGDKPDALRGFRRAIRDRGLNIAVHSTPVTYPMGDEKLLVKAIVGREVPSGRRTIDIGAVVSNVATIHAIFEAVAFGKPVIDRVITVGGDAVRNPSNVKVRIGTPVSALIAECGGLTGPIEKIVLGGPMMGHAIEDISTPITKGTTAILALTAEEINAAERGPCIRCGRCVQACPVGLEPTTLFKMIDHGRLDAAIAEGLMDCRECGCCSYVCPSHIPLVEVLRTGKQQRKGAQ